MNHPTESTSITPRIGKGAATAHHGELLQGVFQPTPHDRLRRGLVSAPCALFRSRVTFEPDGGTEIRGDPPWRVKARHAAELTLEAIGRKGCGGALRIESDVPVGWGLGSSTSDVTAAIHAVADAYRVNLGVSQVAMIAVRAETASDPLMFRRHAVLFAQREGVIIEEFDRGLPPLRVLGFNTDPTGSGIDTLAMSPARYTRWEVEAFRPLLGLMRRAVHDQDPTLVGRVATASARINQRHLPKPRFEHLEQLAASVGAVGLQVAHSGTVAGLLFDASERHLEERVAQARRAIRPTFGETWQFDLGLSEET